MELADIIIVTKADGELRDLARHTQSDYRAAMDLIRAQDKAPRPKVLSCSAVEESGLEEIWRAIEGHNQALVDSGELAHKRKSQAVSWMWREVEERMMGALRAEPGVAGLSQRLEAEVAAGSTTPAAAAAGILAAFRRENGKN